MLTACVAGVGISIKSSARRRGHKVEVM